MCDIDSSWKTDSREYHASLPPLPVSLAFHNSLDFSLVVASPAFLACHSAPAAGNDIAFFFFFFYFFFFYIFFFFLIFGIRLYTDKQTSPSHGTPSREGGRVGRRCSHKHINIAINIRACACYIRTKIRPAEIFYYRNNPEITKF